MEVFAFLVDKAWVLVTQDEKLRKRPHELAALRQANVGAFVLTGRTNRSVEEMLAFLAAYLPAMWKRVQATKRPFVFGVSDKRRFDRLV